MRYLVYAIITNAILFLLGVEIVSSEWWKFTLVWFVGYLLGLFEAHIGKEMS